MTPSELVRAGDLASAREALTAAVRAAPTDTARRFELAELLIVQGDFERADAQLDLIGRQDPPWTASLALLRQLARAELHRADVFERGAAPELAAPATPEVEAALKVLVELRSGSGRAGEVRAVADEAAPLLHGEADGRPFQGLRDLDDRTAGVLEILTSTGKYMWAGWSQVRSLELHPPERLRDLVWRRAELELEGGPSGVVHIPATYFAADATPGQRLGRETAWREAGGLDTGLGQRVLLLGDEDAALSDLTHIVVHPP